MCGRPDKKLKEETMFETLIRPCVRYLVVALAFVAPALAAPASCCPSVGVPVVRPRRVAAVLWQQPERLPPVAWSCGAIRVCGGVLG